MATAVLVTDLTEITDCDSLTSQGSWSGITASLGTSDPSPIEGTGWIGGIIKQASDANTMTFTPTTKHNATGKYVRVIVMTILKPNLKSKALGGIQLLIAGTTSGAAVFNVSGGDFYMGGWEILMCNPYATPDSGTQVVGNINSIGVNFKLAVAAKNVITTQFDWISYGSLFYVYGGTSGDEIGMEHIDAQDTYFLLCEDRKGVYRISLKFQIGDSTGTNSTYFKDSGKILIFENLSVDTAFYELKIVGNSTGTTMVDLSGNFITADSRVYSVDFTDGTNVDEILLNGTIIQNASTVKLGSAVYGSGLVVDHSQEVDTGGATLSGATIKNTTETSTGSLVINSQAEAELLTDMNFQTFGASYAVYVAASVTEFTMDNWQFDDPNGTADIALHWMGTSGTLTISSVNGTNLVTAGCTAESGGAVSVESSVSIAIHVQDEAAANIVGAYVYLDEDLINPGSIVNTVSDANGNVNTAYSGSATEATLRIRKYGYKPWTGSVSLLTDTSTKATMIVDPQQT